MRLTRKHAREFRRAFAAISRTVLLLHLVVLIDT